MREEHSGQQVGGRLRLSAKGGMAAFVLGGERNRELYSR